MSLWRKAAPVSASSCSPSAVSTVPSRPRTFTSSPTQLFAAEGVMLSVTSQLPPECSCEIGGQNSPARAEKRVEAGARRGLADIAAVAQFTEAAVEPAVLAAHHAGAQIGAGLEVIRAEQL